MKVERNQIELFLLYVANKPEQSLEVCNNRLLKMLNTINNAKCRYVNKIKSLYGKNQSYRTALIKLSMQIKFNALVGTLI